MDNFPSDQAIKDNVKRTQAQVNSMVDSAKLPKQNMPKMSGGKKIALALGAGAALGVPAGLTHVWYKNRKKNKKKK